MNEKDITKIVRMEITNMLAVCFPVGDNSPLIRYNKFYGNGKK